MRKITTFENWRDSDKLKKVNNDSGVFEDPESEIKDLKEKPTISGWHELDYYLMQNYPDYRILPCKGYGPDAFDIYAGILAKKDDYTLNKAFVYYYNRNYNIDEVSVKPYPC